MKPVVLSVPTWDYPYVPSEDFPFEIYALLKFDVVELVLSDVMEPVDRSEISNVKNSLREELEFQI